jgi:hypothetical protein
VDLQAGRTPHTGNEVYARLIDRLGTTGQMRVWEAASKHWWQLTRWAANTVQDSRPKKGVSPVTTQTDP